MIRNTRQRNAIQRVIEETERPLGPQEILEKAKAFYPRLGIATVYRNISNLLEDRIITPVEIPGGQTRYELADKKHHHHFHCRECGKVYEVDGCAKDIGKLKPRGFILERHEIILFGKCKTCA